jgi:hypothetical protein
VVDDLKAIVATERPVDLDRLADQDVPFDEVVGPEPGSRTRADRLRYRRVGGPG